MITNLPYGVNDLPLIMRISRKQNKLQKSYRVTYQSKDGKKDFIGAKDKNEVDEKVKELKNHNHNILNIELLKAKVYVKNPEDAPSNVKVQEGKRGGHYYESSQEDNQQERENKPQEFVNNIKTLDKNSDEITDLVNLLGHQFQFESSKPLDVNYIKNILEKNNIQNTNITILPFNIKEVFGFVRPKQTNIYLSSTDNKNITIWINQQKDLLKKVGYDDNELKDINVDNKMAGTIIHEMGHIKVNKAIHIEECNLISDRNLREQRMFHEYIKYIHKFYNIDTLEIFRVLDELLAEEYRQLVAGEQAQLPNRYLYRADTIHSAQYKFKKGRLDILRKMGVF